MVKYIKSKVIGTGKENDAYRPEIIDTLEKTDGGFEGEWSAVYYPPKPPYDYCVVRAVVPDEKVILDTKETSVIQDLRGFCTKNSYFLGRWKEQAIEMDLKELQVDGRN